MTTKHTPGPWRYEAGRNGRPPYVIRGTEGGFVVVGMTADRQEADARLIAAAPELLAALEDLVQNDMQSIEYDGQMLSVCADCGTQDGEHTSNCAYVRARAAIAKALGHHPTPLPDEAMAGEQEID